MLSIIIIKKVYSTYIYKIHPSFTYLRYYNTKPILLIYGYSDRSKVDLRSDPNV